MRSPPFPATRSNFQRLHWLLKRAWIRKKSFLADFGMDKMPCELVEWETSSSEGFRVVRMPEDNQRKKERVK